MKELSGHEEYEDYYIHIVLNDCDSYFKKHISPDSVRRISIVLSTIDTYKYKINTNSVASKLVSQMFLKSRSKCFKISRKSKINLLKYIFTGV